jgi:hypothetical protein
LDEVLAFMLENDIRRDWLLGYYIAMGAWPKVDADMAEASNGQQKVGDYMSVKNAMKANHAPAKQYNVISASIARAKVIFGDSGSVIAVKV